jgi:hypothetical protein
VSRVAISPEGRHFVGCAENLNANVVMMQTAWHIAMPLEVRTFKLHTQH